MFAQVHYPERLLPQELDRYLAQGWFRMGQTIFTTNFLHFKQQFYSAIWLRIVLQDFKEDKNKQRLFRKNERFRMVIREASLDIQKEELFARYKQAVSFDTSPSLYHLMYGKTFNNVYQTLEVNLFDEDRLIGVGFFDVGRKSAAGITSFYDPDYKKFSLGKYLIYLKLRYCKDNSYDFFYPGYFVPGYSFFNYKLELGKDALEFLDINSNTWKNITFYATSPFQIMQEKLDLVRQSLNDAQIPNTLFKYEFFDANLFPELKDAGLFDFPVFLNCFSFHADRINPLVVFDVRDELFYLLQCRSIWDSHLPEAAPDMYAYHLLKCDEKLFVTRSAGDMAKRIIKIFKDGYISPYV